jgi:dynein heavy chain, axonemal
MDMKLLDNLKTYNVEKTRKQDADNAKKRIQKILKDNKEIPPEEMPAYIMKAKSLAAGGLYSWCESTLKCYDINKEVEPKKQKAREMKAQKEKGEKELAETEANLAQLNESLAILNAKKKENQDELNELQRKSAEMTRKLNAASQLITGLGSEQTRWTQDMELIKIDKVKLVGDCLTGSAFLSYCGPFNSILRQKMIFETWKQDLINKELPNKEDFQLATFLSNDVEISQWNADGLPADELSI